MDVDWRERAVWFVGVTDWWELGWFVGVTVGVHAGVVSLLCAALALVERYKLFQEAKIQIKVLISHQFLILHKVGRGNSGHGVIRATSTSGQR